MANRSVTLRLGDDDHLVELLDETHATLSGGDRVIRFEPGSDGYVTLWDGPRQVPAVVAIDGTTRWVFIDGTTLRFEAVQAASRTAPRHAVHDTLTSPMPATVIKVHVAAGAAVTRGDVLIVLEAMKMELPIRAPEAGTVTDVHCREGDLVQPGVPLVELS